MRKAASKMGPDLFPLILEVKAADLAACRDERRQDAENSLERLKALWEEISREGAPLTLKELAVTGSDLIRHGMKPGPALGETLNALLEIVLEEPEKNTKEYLLANLPKET